MLRKYIITFEGCGILVCHTIVDFVIESQRKKDEDGRVLSSWSITGLHAWVWWEPWEGVVFRGYEVI